MDYLLLVLEFRLAVIFHYEVKCKLLIMYFIFTIPNI